MIKLKDKTLIITGKDEKLLKKYAKQAKMTPRTFLLAALKKVMEKYTFFEKDISLEKLP